MALELKGLKGKAIKAAANLDRLNAAYDAFNVAAPAHAADVEGLTPQIEALTEDLTFATQILGNSAGQSNASLAKLPDLKLEPPKEIEPPETETNQTDPPPPSPSPPAVGLQPNGPFQSN